MGHRKLSLAIENHYLYWFVKNIGYREPLKSGKKRQEKARWVNLGNPQEKRVIHLMSLAFHIQV